VASYVRGRPTIQDVAVRARVTKTTVSKYLNVEAGYYVAESTRQRIEQAIRELDFQPNELARGLTQSKSMTIGLIVADIRNPFYPEIMAGVQRAVEPRGYTLVFGSSGGDAQREHAIVRSMTARQVDGIILCSARLAVVELEALTRSRMHFVLASRNLEEAITDSVVVDNRAGAALAVDHLVALGHRRIAHIAGPQDVVPFRDRQSGYLDAMDRHGLSGEVIVLDSAASTTESGFEATSRLLDRVAPPTAVFVANDMMALGSMDAARRLGVAVPGGLSIVGFDNIPIAANLFISLTTVDSLAARLGEDAGQLLLRRIDERDERGASAIEAIVLEPELHIRGTTSPPA
jgi:DNA-binding LacI/PurR family transcriptional regulator